jgi:hypothetical protein
LSGRPRSCRVTRHTLQLERLSLCSSHYHRGARAAGGWHHGIRGASAEVDRSFAMTGLAHCRFWAVVYVDSGMTAGGGIRRPGASVKARVPCRYPAVRGSANTRRLVMPALSRGYSRVSGDSNGREDGTLCNYTYVPPVDLVTLSWDPTAHRILAASAARDVCAFHFVSR